MALTRKQRETLIEKIGFLDGISWVFAIDERLAQFSEAVECVRCDLRIMLKDDDRPRASIEDRGDHNA